MSAAANADDYAAARVGIFFPANNQTSADGNLTGQCVTLDKWFMAEMSKVPNPFAARGHARYMGQTLVSQGLADAVPAGQQKRGDIVCYEYGEYGHTGVLLSGNRLFQENANAAGATRRVLSDGTVVYSSTIVPLYSSLGGVAPKFYRLKSYSEVNDMATNPTYQQVLDYFTTFIDGPLTADQQNYYVARPLDVLLSDLLQYNYDAKVALRKNVGALAAQVAQLTAQITSMGNNPTPEQVQELQAQLNAANNVAAAAQAQVDALTKQKDLDTQTGNAFLRWLGDQLNKLLGKS